MHRTPDPELPDRFFYRVDALAGVRTIRRQPFLRPARWDTGDRYPHVELLEADRTRTPHQGIFRLSLWRTLDVAIRDWRTRASEHPMVLMRMLRTVVRDRLHEWTFAEDDHLDGNAELIWKVGGIDEDLNGFHVGGVPLDELEVFDSHTGSWTRWHDSPDTRLDAERLSAVGWSPIAIETRQGGSGTAYWAAIPELSHRPTERGYWCVITLDESVPGTLGGEQAALSRVMEQLLHGPLCQLSGSVAGVLTLTPTRERVWTEQFEIAWIQDEARWPSWLRAKPQPRLTLKRKVELSVDDVARLIADSRLPAARPEFKPWIWRWPS